MMEVTMTWGEMKQLFEQNEVQDNDIVGYEDLNYGGLYRPVDDIDFRFYDYYTRNGDRRVILIQSVQFPDVD